MAWRRLAFAVFLLAAGSLLAVSSFDIVGEVPKGQRTSAASGRQRRGCCPSGWGSSFGFVSREMIGAYKPTRSHSRPSATEQRFLDQCLGERRP
jgi:hypothetical protein